MNKHNIFEYMEQAYKFSELIAKSSSIPMHYRGKAADVFVAVCRGYYMNQNPFVIMDNTFPSPNGTMNMKSAFLINLANASGLFTSGIRYTIKGEGADLEVTAYLTPISTGEEISATVTMKQAIAEGWTRNPKYKTLPELMLQYRAATFLVRTHCPEVMSCMTTIEEMEDIGLAKDNTIQLKNPPIMLGEEESMAIECVAEELKVFSPEETKMKLQELKALIKTHNVAAELLDQWCKKAKVNSIDELPVNIMEKCIIHLKKM